MSTTTLRRLAGAGLTAVALALSACGGSGDDDKKFIDASNKVTAEISSIGTDIGSTVQGAAQQTDAQLQKQFTDLADRMGKAVTQLDDLDAPNDDIGKTVDSLSASLTKAQKDLENIATAAGASDANGAKTATEALVKDSPAVSAGNKKLKTETAALDKDS